jgi:predicted RNase H-like HicB family nuclease
MSEVIYRTEVFQEGEQYVGLCPELNVSSFGDTPEEAKRSLQEAVDAFFEGCDLLGTLVEVLEESGFTKEGDVWRLRERAIEEAAAMLPSVSPQRSQEYSKGMQRE